MGFAEQLAAKAAEAKSLREKTVNGGNSGSVGGGRTKARRPRIRPIDDDEYGDSAVDHVVEGGQWKSAGDSNTAALSDSFVEQLKQRAKRGEIRQTSEQDSNTAPVLNASDTHVTNNDSTVVDKRDQPMDSQRQPMDTREASFTSLSPVPMQMQRGQSTEPSPSVSKVTYRSRADSRDQPQHCEANRQMIQRNLKHVDSPAEQPQKQPPQHDSCETADTTAIFGAWAQIEQLQRRLKEAESRAERETRRAELAEQRGVAMEAAPRNLGGADSQVEKPSVNDSDCVKKGLQMNGSFTHEAKISSDESAKDAVMTKKLGYREGESAESFETVALVSEECPPDRGYETPLKTDKHTSNNNANDELLEWMKRALEAEDRLMKQDYSMLVSTPHSSTTTRPPPSQQQPPPTSADESDLIQLKNAEIEVLRSQISRLELRIKEESQRNSEMLQAYLPHHDSQRPPLVVAEYTSSIAGGPSHEYEFRMLRDEIRNLQYQLSQKNRNTTNTSAQSTTGSTLSSLENETEEEENEDGGGAQSSSSSWGLCCVRRSRKGYGRVNR